MVYAAYPSNLKTTVYRSVQKFQCYTSGVQLQISVSVSKYSRTSLFIKEWGLVTFSPTQQYISNIKCLDFCMNLRNTSNKIQNNLNKHKCLFLMKYKNLLAAQNTRAVRTVTNVCTYNPHSCFIVPDQSFGVFSRE